MMAQPDDGSRLSYRHLLCAICPLGAGSPLPADLRRSNSKKAHDGALACQPTIRDSRIAQVQFLYSDDIG